MGNAFSKSEDILKTKLQKHTVHELLEWRARSVNPEDWPLISMTSNTTLEGALNILGENRILAAPVFDVKTGVLKELIDYFDILRHVVQLYAGTTVESVVFGPDFRDWYVSSTKKNDAEQVLNEKAVDFMGTSVEEVVGLSGMNPAASFTITEDAPLASLLATFASGLHRAIVKTGNTKNPYTLVSQTDFVTFLMKELQKGNLAVFDGDTIESLKLAKESDIVRMEGSEMAIVGFQKIDSFKVSAIPIEVEGQLRCQLSISDLKGLKAENFSALLLNALEYLEVYSPQSQAPVTVQPTATLADVIRLFDQTKVHRLWVVNERMQLKGLISISDLSRLLDEYCNK